MRSLSLCGNKSFGHFTQIQNYNDLSCEYMLGSLWGSEGGPVTVVDDNMTLGGGG